MHGKTFHKFWFDLGFILIWMQAGGYGHHAVADLYCVSMTAFWGLESCQKCHRIGKSLVADMPLQINPLSICFLEYNHTHTYLSVAKGKQVLNKHFTLDTKLTICRRWLPNPSCVRSHLPQNLELLWISCSLLNSYKCPHLFWLLNRD